MSTLPVKHPGEISEEAPSRLGGGHGNGGAGR